MITTLDTISWSKELETGNAQFVETGGDIYVVAQVRSDNSFTILTSPAPGNAFTVVATVPLTTQSFDPVVTFANGKLHIVGCVDNGKNVDLVKYTFDPANPTVVPATTLVTASYIRGAYDVCGLGTDTYVVAVVTDLPSPSIYQNKHAMLGFRLDANDVILSTDELAVSPMRSGDTYGAVSVLSPDGVRLELYYHSHPKLVTFQDVLIAVNRKLYDGSAWNLPVVLYSFLGRHIDSKLTVVPMGAQRYLSSIFYTQLNHPQALVGNLLLGSSTDATSWSFNITSGSVAVGSIQQAVISVSAAHGALLAYLLQPVYSPRGNWRGDITYAFHDLVTYNGVNYIALINNKGVDPTHSGTWQVAPTSWPLRVATIDSSLGTMDVPGFYNQIMLTWLRGTKSVVDDGSVWAIVGERLSGSTTLPVFVSDYNVAPIPVLNPSTATLYRSQVLVLDGSQSSDVDADVLTYTWDWTPKVSALQVVPTGPRATVQVDRSIGGAAFPFTVTLSVNDGLHPAQNVTANITVPANAAPTVDFTHDAVSGAVVALPLQVNRNATVLLRPTITGTEEPDDTTTFLWEQVTGTPVTMTFVVQSTLEFTTNGVDVAGETLQFRLTVNDGVNGPVSQTVDVAVAAQDLTNLDTHRLSRSIWTGTLGTRNTTQPWGPLSVSALYTDLNEIRRSSVLDGTDRYLMLSSASVTIYGGINPQLLLLRKLLTPNRTPIVDAVHTENDQTLVLDATGMLYRYSKVNTLTTDSYDATINLMSLSSLDYAKLLITPAFSGSRVIAAFGTKGCLLVQVRNSDLHIQAVVELSPSSGMLYGSADVQWMRVSNVENIHTGKVLLGSVANITANITAVNITNNQLTVTSANVFQPNDLVTFSDLTAAAFLNGLRVAVVASDGDSFTASYQHVDFPTTPDLGLAVTSGQTFETLIDLSHGQIIGTWDASNLHNRTIHSGEILFEAESDYAGQPSAPILLLPVVQSNGQIQLTWQQARPDLVSQYNVEQRVNGGNWEPVLTVTAGMVTSVTTQITVGQTHDIRVRATSPDGPSDYSNIQTIVL